MSVRAALAVFDNDALVALANKGLLRRAQKLFEAGRFSDVVDAAQTINLVVDGQDVTLTADGPRKAVCACPASGICQHILAAVLYLRDPADGTAAQPNPLEDVLALDANVLRKWAGLPALRAALELVGEVKPTASAGTLTMTLQDQPEVRWLTGQGLDGAVCKTSTAKRKPIIAAAILSVWKTNGVDNSFLIEPIAKSIKQTITADTNFLHEIRKALENAASTALSSSPEVLEERLFALSVSGRAEGLPRLSASLRRLSRLIRQARRHHVDLDEEDLLLSIAETYAVTRALIADPSNTMLHGQVRRGYVDAGSCELIGFGADMWTTQSGARGVTGHFFDPAASAWRTVSLARTGNGDTHFDPARAYASKLLWQTGTLSTLSKARVNLTNARRAGARLSASEQTTGSRLDEEYDVDALPGGPPAFSDWADLHAHLRVRDGLTLSEGFPDREPVILSAAAFEAPYFDDFGQEAVWPLADVAGRWIGLRVSATKDGANRLDAIEYHLRTVTARYVMATVSVSADGWRLSPYALVIERDDALALVNLDFDEIDTATRKRWWWNYLNKPKPKHGFAQSTGFVVLRDVSTTATLIADILDRLVAYAQAGGRDVDGAPQEIFKQYHQRLENAGLKFLADLTRPFAGESDIAPSHLLCLSYALGIVKRYHRSMPLLRHD